MHGECKSNFVRTRHESASIRARARAFCACTQKREDGTSRMNPIAARHRTRDDRASGTRTLRNCGSPSTRFSRVFDLIYLSLSFFFLFLILQHENRAGGAVVAVARATSASPRSANRWQRTRIPPRGGIPSSPSLRRGRIYSVKNLILGAEYCNPSLRARIPPRVYAAAEAPLGARRRTTRCADSRRLQISR